MRFQCSLFTFLAVFWQSSKLQKIILFAALSLLVYPLVPVHAAITQFSTSFVEQFSG